MKEFARSIRHQERFAERYTLQEKHLGLRPIEVSVRTTKHCEYAQRSTLTCTRAFKSKYVSAPILSEPFSAQAGGVHRGAMKPPPKRPHGGQRGAPAGVPGGVLHADPELAWP